MRRSPPGIAGDSRSGSGLWRDAFFSARAAGCAPRGRVSPRRVRRPGPATLTGPDKTAPLLIVLSPPASSTIAFVRFCGILEEADLPFVSASESRTWMPATSRTGAGSSGGFSLGERFGGVEKAGPDCDSRGGGASGPGTSNALLVLLVGWGRGLDKTAKSLVGS